MGQFLDEINKSYPAEKRDKAKRIDLNGVPILAEDALVMLDKAHDQALEHIRKYYCPLKAPGGPLSKSFQHFLNVMSQYKPVLPKTEVLYKEEFMKKWPAIANKIVNEGYLVVSPSYRSILFNESGIVGRRETLHKYAKEFLKIVKEGQELADWDCWDGAEDWYEKEIINNNNKRLYLTNIVATISWNILLESSSASEIEAYFKTQVMNEWPAIVLGIVSEGCDNDSPSYRGVLFNDSSVQSKRETVHGYALEFLELLDDERVYKERKIILSEKIADLAWKTLLLSPMATVIEAGIAMDIDPEGINRLAINTVHGGRSMACDNMVNHFTHVNAIKYHPLIQQITHCGNFLGKLSRMTAAKVSMKMFADQGEEIFYDGLEGPAGEISIFKEEVERLYNDLNANFNAWEHMHQPPSAELCFFSSSNPLRRPYLPPVITAFENKLHLCGIGRFFRR